jgi:hypothetical protein
LEFGSCDQFVTAGEGFTQPVALDELHAAAEQPEELELLMV